MNFNLHTDVLSHRTSFIRRVLNAGADVRATDGYGFEPIDYLWVRENPPEALEKALEILHVLLAAGAVIRNKTIRRLMEHQAPLALLDAVFLAYKPSTIDYTDALFSAVLYENDIDIARYLLRRGADPHHEHLPGSPRDPPLDIVIIPTRCLDLAIIRGNDEYVRLLLDHGADPHAVSKVNGTTSMHWHLTSGITRKTVIGDLLKCKRAFDAIKHRLHRGLAEYVFHPKRLLKRGYFDDLHEDLE